MLFCVRLCYMVALGVGGDLGSTLSNRAVQYCRILLSFGSSHSAVEALDCWSTGRAINPAPGV